MQFYPSEIRGVQIARHSVGTRLAPLPARAQPGRWRETRTLAPRGAISPLLVSLGNSGDQAIRCLEGDIAAIVVDCRANSSTFGDSRVFEMRADVAHSLIVPAGVAVGWQAVAEYAEVGMSMWANTENAYTLEEVSCGVEWPVPVAEVLQRGAEVVDMDYFELQAAKCSFSGQSVASPNAVNPVVRPGLGAYEAPTVPMPQRVRSVRQDGRPTILVIGSTGQLGHDLVRRLRGVGRVIGACRKPRGDGHLPIATTVDVSRPASIREAIRRTRPNLIVNAAALTDVAACEESPRRAQGINANAPAVMAEAAKKIGAGLIHFCSDKVFGGDGERPLSENSETRPVNQYGLTKLRGTQAVMNSGVDHLVLRTGWLYSTHGTNFVQNIVDQITYRATLKIATDYFGTPTSTDWLAQTLADLLQRAGGDINGWLQEHGGLYHAAALGFASRLDVADHVVATCRQHSLPVVLHKLTGVSIDSLSGAARCPKNCRLDVSKLATKFQIALPGWREQLSQQLAVILGVGEGRLLSIA